MLVSMLIVFLPIIGTFAVGALAERFGAWRETGDRGLQWTQAFFLVSLSTVVVFVVVPIGHAGIAKASAEYEMGLFTWFDIPIFLIVLSGLLILDASEWFAHWSMHRFPLLWRLHAVHHSDDFLDTSTAFRFHPVDVLYRYCVVGLGIAVFSVPIQSIVAYAVLLIGFNFWEHANLRTPAWTRKLGVLVITPDLHRLHHSDEEKHHNSNFGVVFSIWDRFFGTLIPQEELTARTNFGLGSDHAKNYRQLGQLLLAPLRKSSGQSDQ